MREGREAGDGRVFDRAQAGDGRAVGGVKLLGVSQADVVERGRMAGQAVVGRRVVVAHRVMDRAHLGERVDDGGEPRQVLGDGETGLGRRDGLELAANAVGRGRLHVEGVDVRRAAELVQEENVLGPRLQPRLLGGSQPGGQVQPREPRGAGLEEGPAREPAGGVEIRALPAHDHVPLFNDATRIPCC